MAWETQTTKLGNEERFRRILPLWWHRKSLSSIYSRWKKGLQHSPWDLVLLFLVLQEGGLQSQGCEVWQTRSFPGLLAADMLFTSSRSQNCPDLRGKMGSYSTSPSLLKYSSLYFHRHTAWMWMWVWEEILKQVYLMLNHSVQQKERKEEGKKNTLTFRMKAIYQSFLRKGYCFLAELTVA